MCMYIYIDVNELRAAMRSLGVGDTEVGLTVYISS